MTAEEIKAHYKLEIEKAGSAMEKNLLKAEMNHKLKLVDLNEDISKIEDADMAELLTKLQKLLTNKEAAQATFSRLSSKNLFDFLG